MGIRFQTIMTEGKDHDANGAGERRIGFSSMPVTGTSRDTFTWSGRIKVAKFWLGPVRLQRSGGFSRTEIGKMSAIVEEHEGELSEAWDEYFSG